MSRGIPNGPECAAVLSLEPLLAANMACTMAMVAFVSLVRPIAQEIHMWEAPWRSEKSTVHLCVFT